MNNNSTTKLEVRFGRFSHIISREGGWVGKGVTSKPTQRFRGHDTICDTQCIKFQFTFVVRAQARIQGGGGGGRDPPALDHHFFSNTFCNYSKKKKKKSDVYQP